MAVVEQGQAGVFGDASPVEAVDLAESLGQREPGEDQLGERRSESDDAVDLGRDRRSEVLVVGRAKGGPCEDEDDGERARRHCDPNVAMTKSLVA